MLLCAYSHTPTDPFETAASNIWRHLSLHFLGRPGSCELGIPLACRASSMMASVFSSLSTILRAVTTLLGDSDTRAVTWFITSHSCWPRASLFFLEEEESCNVISMCMIQYSTYWKTNQWLKVVMKWLGGVKLGVWGDGIYMYSKQTKKFSWLQWNFWSTEHFMKILPCLFIISIVIMYIW